MPTAVLKRVCRILPEDAVVIVTSDHGGHDNTHHSDQEEDMTVPLMMYGPGIPKGREIDGPVSIMDIAPTVVRFLGSGATRRLDGKGDLPVTAQPIILQMKNLDLTIIENMDTWESISVYKHRMRYLMPSAVPVFPDNLSRKNPSPGRGKMWIGGSDEENTHHSDH